MTSDSCVDPSVVSNDGTGARLKTKVTTASARVGASASSGPATDRERMDRTHHRRASTARVFRFTPVHRHASIDWNHRVDEIRFVSFRAWLHTGGVIKNLRETPPV